MLKRSLDLFGTAVYGVGVILGAGIYVLIGSAVGLAGNSVWISFVIGAIISSFTGLSYAELSTMFPKAAAEYVYVKSAFKNQLLAFLTGWLIIFSGTVSIATVSLGFSSYFSALFGFPSLIVAGILVLSLSILNFIGIKQSSRVNILFTVIEISGLLLVIILGFGKFGSVNYFEIPSTSGVFAAAALVFFAYLGFEDIVNIAEETKNPSKTIPRALIISIVVTTVFYVLVALAVVNLAPWQTLGNVDAPLAYAVSTVLGSEGFTLLSYVALFATANTILINLIVASRMIYGMAKDAAFPAIFSKLHQKTQTPWVAILIMLLLSFLFLLLENIDLVANLTSLGVFFTFALVNLSVIWLRYKKQDLNRPFRTPLNVGKFPIMPFFGLLSCLLMVSQFNLSVLFFGSVVLGSGIVFFFAYKKLSKNSQNMK